MDTLYAIQKLAYKVPTLSPVTGKLRVGTTYLYLSIAYSYVARRPKLFRIVFSPLGCCSFHHTGVLLLELGSIEPIGPPPL